MVEMVTRAILNEQSRRSNQSQGKPKSAISLSQKTAAQEESFLNSLSSWQREKLPNGFITFKG